MGGRSGEKEVGKKITLTPAGRPMLCVLMVKGQTLTRRGSMSGFSSMRRCTSCFFSCLLPPQRRRQRPTSTSICSPVVSVWKRVFFPLFLTLFSCPSIYMSMRLSAGLYVFMAVFSIYFWKILLCGLPCSPRVCPSVCLAGYLATRSTYFHDFHACIDSCQYNIDQIVSFKCCLLLGHEPLRRVRMIVTKGYQLSTPWHFYT